MARVCLPRKWECSSRKIISVSANVPGATVCTLKTVKLKKCLSSRDFLNRNLEIIAPPIHLREAAPEPCLSISNRGLERNVFEIARQIYYFDRILRSRDCISDGRSIVERFLLANDYKIGYAQILSV